MLAVKTVIFRYPIAAWPWPRPVYPLAISHIGVSIVFFPWIVICHERKVYLEQFFMIQLMKSMHQMAPLESRYVKKSTTSEGGTSPPLHRTGAILLRASRSKAPTVGCWKGLFPQIRNCVATVWITKSEKLISVMVTCTTSLRVHLIRRTSKVLTCEFQT